MAVPFLDLKGQYRALHTEVQEALRPVFENAQFVLGPAVESFERVFAQATGVSEVVAVNTGTSALHLCMLALGVGPGDEVIVPAMTFVATAAAVAYTGATPVFVDVDPATMTLDPAAAASAITARTVGMIPVHLYGHPADLTRLGALCREQNLFLLEDACQAHLATWEGRPCGTVGIAACYSFYPGKNLGAAGEGGAIATNDPAIARQCRLLRDWGQQERYRHDVLGYNYRMEGVQGAVLEVKLRHLPAWTEARRDVAARYRERLLGLPDLTLPLEHAQARHVYHIYAVRHPLRDQLRATLAQRGIQTGLHYPIPVHLQPCFASLGYRPGQLPVAEKIARCELSLPIYPELDSASVEEVCAAVHAALEPVVAA